jgi:hypothetical protein
MREKHIFPPHIGINFIPIHQDVSAGVARKSFAKINGVAASTQSDPLRKGKARGKVSLSPSDQFSSMSALNEFVTFPRKTSPFFFAT